MCNVLIISPALLARPESSDPSMPDTPVICTLSLLESYHGGRADDGHSFQYWETSVDNRGKVRFRRRRVSGLGSTPNLSVPLSDVRTDDQERNRFVERFDAREIKLEEGHGRDSYQSGITEPDVKSADLPERSSKLSSAR